MSFQPAVASPSLGHQTVHSVSSRLRAAAAHGFKLIELVEDDLRFHARDTLGGAEDEFLVQAANDIRKLCDKLAIVPFVFQPFWFYEGLLDRDEHARRIHKLRLWMQLVKILGVRIVQIPTNWMREGTTADSDVIVGDLTEMAEIGLEQDPIVSFAYEGVAWGTHIDTWKGTWDIVKCVNRPNFGLCLDTFHIVAREWGDPTAPGCKRTDGIENLKRSMEELGREVDVNKVFYVQIGDAELLDEPLVKGHPFYNEQQLPRMSWSRNARLFPWEENGKGCLPLQPVIDAIFKTLGFKGYVSMETFSRHLLDQDPHIPERFAAQALKSWNIAMNKIQL